MTNDTTKPADDRPDSHSAENNGEERGILSRVSKWLKKPGKPGEEESHTASPPASTPDRTDAAPASGETLRPEGDPAASTGNKPRRRKRPPRRRSKGPKPEGQKIEATAEGEQPVSASVETAAKEKAAAPARPPRQRPPRKSPDRAKEAPKPSATSQPVKGDTTLKLLINTDEPEECRLVLLESGKVESFTWRPSARRKPRATSTRGG